MSNPKVFVLLSGGLDSSTLLALACEEFGNHNVTAMSVRYGQRHRVKELQAARDIAEQYGVHRRIIDLSAIMGTGGLTDDDQEIPAVSYDEIKGVSPSYVPFRNGLMLAAMTSFAASQLGKEPEQGLIGYGAHAEDAHNWAYPDCTPEFIGAMANAVYVGSYHRLRLWTPFMHSKKHEIVKVGIEIGVPFEITWSCYLGLEKHCGTCPTCRARKESFAKADQNDPTEYVA
jgi:7-cyano-7-deazaguanine synthase